MSDGGVCSWMETRLCPPSGPCEEVCARFESDDPTPWLERNPMPGRNVFENNDPVPDPEDIKAVGDGPHIMLPPLIEGHHYTLTKLPSGREAVIVEEDVEEIDATFEKSLGHRDRFGRNRTQ